MDMQLGMLKYSSFFTFEMLVPHRGNFIMLEVSAMATVLMFFGPYLVCLVVSSSRNQMIFMLTEH